jgi:hypothetical protein
VKANYESLKALAKHAGCSVTDLIVLSRNNDPFYVGTPSDLANGEWFADLWSTFGFGYGVHLRRVHYRLVSQQSPVLMPSGKPYENTEACWDFLGGASKSARYLNLVDPGAFVDRRNPQPHVYLLGGEPGPTVEIDSSLWDAYSFPDFPDYRLENYAGRQHYHIEIWCEKTTMNDVLLPLCRQFNVNLVTGAGEMSITAVLELTRRMNHRPVRILYVSDFDPAGQSMPCAVARKLEFFLRQQNSDADVKLYPIVLTAEQVHQYRLPRTPLKESELRAARFEDRYGSGAVELDAVEALLPGELRRIVTAEIRKYFDEDLGERVFDARQALRDRLDEIRNDILDQYREDIEALENEYTEIREEFEQRMSRYGSRLERVWQAIHGEMEASAPSIDDYPVPEPTLLDEPDDALYDAQRDYLEQLDAYKDWQNKTLEAVA